MRVLHAALAPLLVGALATASASPSLGSPVPLSPDECEGCLGVGGAGAANGAGACAGEMVQISVTVSTVQCYVVAVEPLGIECYGDFPCEATVVRNWSGLPPNSGIEMCFSWSNSGGEYSRCIKPEPSSGAGGSGQDTKDVPLPCGNSSTYSITSACGTSATASAVCENHCE